MTLARLDHLDLQVSLENLVHLAAKELMDYLELQAPRAAKARREMPECPDHLGQLARMELM